MENSQPFPNRRIFFTGFSAAAPGCYEPNSDHLRSDLENFQQGKAEASEVKNDFGQNVSSGKYVAGLNVRV